MANDRHSFVSSGSVDVLDSFRTLRVLNRRPPVSCLHTADSTLSISPGIKKCCKFKFKVQVCTQMKNRSELDIGLQQSTENPLRFYWASIGCLLTYKSIIMDNRPFMSRLFLGHSDSFLRFALDAHSE